MTALDLAAIVAREEAASTKVAELCNGTARWVMRIPAQPDHDPDLLIGASLADIRALITEVERLRSWGNLAVDFAAAYIGGQFETPQLAPFVAEARAALAPGDGQSPALSPDVSAGNESHAVPGE